MATPVPDFSDIAAYADTYGIAEDAERYALIDGIDPDERMRLVAAVEPRMDEINGYLDSLPDDMDLWPPLAYKLMYLAECVEELSF